MDSLYTKNRGKLDNVLFFIIWLKQLFEFQSLFIYQSELNPHYLPGRHPLPQSTLTFLPLFPHCSPPLLLSLLPCLLFALDVCQD